MQIIDGRKFLPAYELDLYDRFWFMGKLWECCGWYSAVYHIAALCLQTGEKRIVAHVQEVELFEEQFCAGLGI